MWTRYVVSLAVKDPGPPDLLILRANSRTSLVPFADFRPIAERLLNTLNTLNTLDHSRWRARRALSCLAVLGNSNFLHKTKLRLHMNHFHHASCNLWHGLFFNRICKAHVM